MKETFTTSERVSAKHSTKLPINSLNKYQRIHYHVEDTPEPLSSSLWVDVLLENSLRKERWQGADIQQAEGMRMWCSEALKWGDQVYSFISMS